jgi:hypothetical protein
MSDFTTEEWGIIMDRHRAAVDWLEDHVINYWAYSVDDCKCMIEQVQVTGR